MKKLGKYEILEELGRGAMGIVYKARDPIINRMVALKTITTNVADNPKLLQRFYREAQSAGSLQHPNIVTIYDMGDEGSIPFIAMGLVDGQSLDKVIAHRLPLPVSLKLVYAVQACRAFDYAHKRGIIHRDIKPGNVMVDKEGVIKVVDFGIARVLETSDTKSGVLIGTFAYMPPELYHGERADERSDIFSFGVLLYELLTYRRPFLGDAPASLMQNICQQEPPPLNMAAGECPPELEPLVLRTLEKSPSERFQSMEDLLLELEPICKSMQAGTVADLVAQSRQLFQGGEFSQARDLLRQALQVDFANTQARMLLEKVNSELKRILIRPRALQHVETGRALLEQGKLQEAKAEADNALQLDPAFDLALNLRQQIQQEVGRAQLISEKLQASRQRLAEGMPDEAEALVAEVLATDPSNRQAQKLQQQVSEERALRQKRLHLLEVMQQGRVLWTRQKYQDCIDLLENLQKEFPEEDEVRKLLETAREDRAEQHRQQALEEARNLLAAERYEECEALLSQLQEKFPGDEIPALMEVVRRDQARQRKLKSLTEARNLLASRHYDESIALLSDLQREFADDDDIPRLLSIARENQEEQRRQQCVAEARNLLAARCYEECNALLTDLRKQFPDDDEIPALMEIVRRDQVQQRKLKSLTEARNLLASRRYDESIASLSELQKEFAEDDEIPRLLKIARENQEEQRRQQCVAEARNLLAARRYDDCNALLTDLRKQFPRDDEIPALMEVVRQERSQQRKLKSLTEARNLRASRHYAESVALLTELQKEFPDDDDISKLLEGLLEDQAEQRKLEGLTQARTLLASRRYEDCVALLAGLRKEFPRATEIPKLLETANEEKAEQQKQEKLAEARALLAAQRFEDALAVLSPLLAAQPKDFVALKLRTLVQNEREKHEKSERLKREWEILKNLVGKEAYPEVVAQAEQLLREFPGDADLTRLLAFARDQQAQIERELQLRKKLDEVEEFLKANHLAEAIAAADAGLKSFPENADLLHLRERIVGQKKREETRREIENRVREIRTRINQEQLSEAIQIAKDTLDSLGPDTTVTQLLTSAAVEYETREKKREQDRRLEDVRTLVRAGDIGGATLLLDETVKNLKLAAFDPRVQRLTEELEAAKLPTTVQAHQDAISTVETRAREYAFMEGPPPPSPLESISAESVQHLAAAAAASSPSAFPSRPEIAHLPPEAEFVSPISGPQVAQPVPDRPDVGSTPPPASPGRTLGALSPASVEISRPARLPEKISGGRKKKTVPAVRARSEATSQSTSRRPLTWLLPIPLLVALAATLLWVGQLAMRKSPAKPKPQENSSLADASKPPENPVETQQRDLVNAADKDRASGNLDAAKGKLERAKNLTGPLNSVIAQKLGEVEREISDASLARLWRQEELLWNQAKEKTDTARFAEAQRDLREILDMPPGGRRKDDARNYINQVIPQRQREERLFADARQAMGRTDPASLSTAADLFSQVIKLGGPRQQESRKLLDDVHQAQTNLGIAGLVESARADLKRGDFGLARQRVFQIQQMGGDAAPLSAEFNQAEQARFGQLDASLNQLKQSDDDSVVQRLQEVQAQLQALADGGGPTANDARRDAASIPDVIRQVQRRATDRAAEDAYQQALQRYQRASDTSALQALQASRSEFQAIARGGGHHAGDAQRTLIDKIEPKIAALTAAAELPQPPIQPAGPPAVKPPVDEKPAVRAVVQQYADAFQQRDADALRKIWPYMSKAEYDGSKQAFSYASAIRMTLSNETVDVDPDGATATVTVDIAQDYTPKVGKAGPKVDHTVFHLVKRGAMWVIKDRK